MLGDNNKNSGESILLFGKSIFLFLKSFYWRKMDWISFYFLSLQSHSAEVHLSNNITRYIFWWDMFCSKSITHGLFINFFFQGAFLFFFRRIFYLSTRFLCLLNLESSVTFHLVSEYLCLVLFWMLWTWVTRTIYIGNDNLLGISYKFFFSVSNEMRPVLVTRVLSNNI